MNLIFCGHMFTEQSLQEAYLNSKVGIQMAPHIFQSNLVRGFSELDNIKLQIISLPPVGSFPIHYRDFFIKEEQWENGVQIGFLNVPILKKVQQKHKIIRALEEKIKECANEKVYVISYHFYEPFLQAVQYLKQKYNNLHACLIVTDCVPGREDMDIYMTRKARKRGDRVIQLTKYYDSFVLLTKHLADALEIKNKPFVILECICDSTQAQSMLCAKKTNRCLYSGSLNAEYGVGNLAKVISQMSSCELWICGDGAERPLVEKVASSSENIRYYGYVDQKTLQTLRDECDFLINPRRPTGTYTKYSFPSKTAEYMMSGKPSLLYKLEGIPDEYDEYLNYLFATNDDDMKRNLEFIFSKNYSELLAKAQRGRNFLLSQKNPEKQASRIVEMLLNEKSRS